MTCINRFQGNENAEKAENLKIQLNNIYRQDQTLRSEGKIKYKKMHVNLHVAPN